jgi:hypothetical protein
MIDRQHGKLLFECDSCGEVFDGESGEFSEVWAAAKRDGWRTRKMGDEDWVHSCPNCGV